MLSVGIFNDSFPPTVDGVANVALNYARIIHCNHGKAVVATPWYPNVTDTYPFEVVRYPSTYLSKRLTYRAGNPFDPHIIHYLKKMNLDIIHAHSPFTSVLLARTLRLQQKMPIIFTYHTKYNIDIEKITDRSTIRSASIKLLMANINACDEIWVVSKGAGDNLRSLGYKGDFILMENGTDFQKGRSSQRQVAKLRNEHRIPANVPIFLYVGRMMWYKGIRLSLNGLSIAKQKGLSFRMIFIGEGIDLPEIKEYAKSIGLANECIFTGLIPDRELLRTYYSLSDLFLFPSSYDTNGIVVNEASACSCPSLLIKGSCAAEKITQNENGILNDEEPCDLAFAVHFYGSNPHLLKAIGENAAKSIYLPWHESVKNACNRYEYILDNYIPRKILYGLRNTYYHPRNILAGAGKKLHVQQRFRYLKDKVIHLRR